MAAASLSCCYFHCFFPPLMRNSGRIPSSLFFRPFTVTASQTASVISSDTPSLQETASTIPGIAKVVLKKGKAQLFRRGSPMVYSGAVDCIIGRPPPKTGDTVLVADGAEKLIGWGFYNSVSMFCVRIMQFEDEAERDPFCVLNAEKLVERRIDAARDLRRRLGLPCKETNTYRLVNSEGDRLSGLIVDIFGDVAVIASSAAWVEKHRSSIEQEVAKIPHVNHVIWRPSVDILKEEGIDLKTSKDQDFPLSISKTKVLENGIHFSVALEGQKTGFYADQRENRHYLSTISNGLRVLDVCCYSGGFALNALLGGAIDVTGVDSSSPAIEIAKENICLNDFGSRSISFLKDDAAEFLKGAASRKELWDLVILDPPKLAPSRKVLQRASGMYRNLNALAMKVTREGCLLMTCSCSGAMTQSGTFLQVLQGAALTAGRKITVLRQAGAASDHPIDPSYPEGAYLSNYLLRVL